MKPRALGAVLFVSAVSLFSAARLFVGVSDYYPHAPKPDSITEFTSRFSTLRTMLPNRGVIGYITDPGVSPADANAKAEFYLTQYALAPVIVSASPDSHYVIGNFHQPISTGSLQDRGFKLIREFGSGIALLENEKFK